VSPSVWPVNATTVVTITGDRCVIVCWACCVAHAPY
jgi:hypothetical protein